MIQLPKLGTDLEVQLVPGWQRHVLQTGGVLHMLHHGFVEVTLIWIPGLFLVTCVLAGMEVAVIWGLVQLEFATVEAFTSTNYYHHMGATLDIVLQHKHINF